MDKKNFETLENKIKLKFVHRNSLMNIFIHRSYLNEHKKYHLPSNEQLEFLGDSVLSLITSYYLFIKYPKLQEGDYTDIKAAIVRTESLAEAADHLNLGEYLYLSRGQDQEGGRKNVNILADCFEALIAGIFLEFGFKKAYQFVLDYLYTNKLDHIVDNKLYLSPKSRLQEHAQAHFKVIPTYQVEEQMGPEHKRIFRVIVSIKGKKLGLGTGHSKKEAEEAAAKKALEKLKTIL